MTPVIYNSVYYARDDRHREEIYKRLNEVVEGTIQESFERLKGEVKLCKDEIEKLEEEKEHLIDDYNTLDKANDRLKSDLLAMRKELNKARSQQKHRTKQKTHKLADTPQAMTLELQQERT